MKTSREQLAVGDWQATHETPMEHENRNSLICVRSVSTPWLCAAVVIFCALSASAQYAIPWHTIDGGGATAPSTGGVYALSGTIGQVDTGRVASTNDHYRLESGFWGIAVQQAGFPSLSVSQEGTNAVIRWVTPETQFMVQFTTNLTASTVWTDLGLATATNGVTNAIAIPLTDAERAFFRLRRK